MKPPLRVLVTGATGFIGGHLARCLVAQGHQVRALVRHRSKGKGACEERAQGLAAAGLELVWGDITDSDAVREAVDGTEVVFHLAAARDAWGTPESVYQSVNVGGTQHLLEAAAETGVQRFVYCSAGGVARYPGHLAADETLPYSEATSQLFYHRSKTQAEQMVLEWSRAGRVPALVVRPVITYGPGDETGFVTRLVALLVGGQFVWVGNGRNHVDLVYVDDLVAGMYGALEKGAAGRAFILSGTAPIQVRDLVGEICGLLGRQPPRVGVPVPMARAAGWAIEMLYKVRDRLGLSLGGSEPFITRDKVATLTVDRGFSHARAREELGYCPKIGYSKGLRRTLCWLRNTGRLPENLGSD